MGAPRSGAERVARHINEAAHARSPIHKKRRGPAPPLPAWPELSLTRRPLRAGGLGAQVGEPWESISGAAGAGRAAERGPGRRWGDGTLRWPRKSDEVQVPETE